MNLDSDGPPWLLGPWSFIVKPLVFSPCRLRFKSLKVSEEDVLTKKIETIKLYLGPDSCQCILFSIYSYHLVSNLAPGLEPLAFIEEMLRESLRAYCRRDHFGNPVLHLISLTSILCFLLSFISSAALLWQLKDPDLPQLLAPKCIIQKRTAMYRAPYYIKMYRCMHASWP